MRILYCLYIYNFGLFQGLSFCLIHIQTWLYIYIYKKKQCLTLLKIKMQLFDTFGMCICLFENAISSITVKKTNIQDKTGITDTKILRIMFY